MKYEFEDVIVADYKLIGDITGDGLPEEKVSLAYGKMKVRLHRLRLDGKSAWANSGRIRPQEWEISVEDAL